MGTPSERAPTEPSPSPARPRGPSRLHLHLHLRLSPPPSAMGKEAQALGAARPTARPFSSWRPTRPSPRFPVRQRGATPAEQPQLRSALLSVPFVSSIPQSPPRFYRRLSGLSSVGLRVWAVLRNSYSSPQGGCGLLVLLIKAAIRSPVWPYLIFPDSKMKCAIFCQ